MGFPESLKCLEFLLHYLLESGEYENLLNDYIESATITEAETDHLVAVITNNNMTDGSKYEDDNSLHTNAKQSTRRLSLTHCLLECIQKAKMVVDIRRLKLILILPWLSPRAVRRHIPARSLRLHEIGRIASRRLRQRMKGRKGQAVEKIPTSSLPKDLLIIVLERRTNSYVEPQAFPPLTKLDTKKRETKRR